MLSRCYANVQGELCHTKDAAGAVCLYSEAVLVVEVGVDTESGCDSHTDL